MARYLSFIQQMKSTRKEKKEVRKKVVASISCVALCIGAFVACVSSQQRAFNNYGLDFDDLPISGSSEGASIDAGRLLSESVSLNRTESCPEDPLYSIPYLMLILYMFFALAIICDDYFEPVLSVISEKLSLSEDVAGATFMAAGSSAPELLTSFSDALGSQNNIGIGTIVGSAMFNILIIVALAAAVTKGDVLLDWRPLARDSTFYILSILLLYFFMVNERLTAVQYERGGPFVLLNKTLNPEDEDQYLKVDTGYGSINTVEAVFLMVGYAGYIVFMVFNQRIFKYCKPVSPKETDKGRLTVSRGRQHSIKRMIEEFGEAGAQEGKSANGGENDPEKGEGAQKESVEIFHINPGERHQIKRVLESFDDLESVNNSTTEEEKNAIIDEEYDNPFAFPDNLLGRVWYVLTLPIAILYFVTIPNSTNPRFEKLYLVTFVMNIVWISLACYVMVTFATRVGCLWEVDPVVMGIVLLAAGTSVPDAIASMIVARQGFADMAIANALGSNVFDILLGLGLPWLVAIIAFGQPVPVNLSGITTGIFILLGAVLLFLMTIAFNRCKMNSRLGLMFVFLYAIYLTYTILEAKCVVTGISARCSEEGTLVQDEV